jgi:hypothetical protein
MGYRLSVMGYPLWVMGYGLWVSNKKTILSRNEAKD